MLLQPDTLPSKVCGRMHRTKHSTAWSSFEACKLRAVYVERWLTMQSCRSLAGSRGSSWPCALVASNKRLDCQLGQLCSVCPQISRRCFCTAVGLAQCLDFHVHMQAMS